MRTVNINKNIFMKRSVSRSMSGFTLLELMIVVVVVGVLMAVALPSYQDSVRKSRRSDAMSAMLDVANRQEQVMMDTNAYTADMTALGFAADPMISPEGYYSIDATIGTNSYTITATPVGSEAQSDDAKCTTFTLTSAGVKGDTGTHSDQCWGL